MSHEIRYADYPLNCNKKGIEEGWNEVVRHEDYQEGASGLPHPIRWIETTPFDSREAAEQYIEDHDNGWYDCLAVKYLDFSKVKPNKKIEELNTKTKTLYASYLEKNSKFHFQNVKAEFIGCKNCGSKISKKYLNSNYCPVCRKDLRPETTLKSIQSAKTALEKTKATLKVETTKYNEKCKKQADVRWLVKVEYHT